MSSDAAPRPRRRPGPRRRWPALALAVVLVAGGVAVGAAVGGGLRHLTGGTDEVSAVVSGAVRTEGDCLKRGERGESEWSFTYTWAEDGRERTTVDVYCTSNPPSAGDERTIWVDEEDRVVSYLSPVAGRVAAVGVPLGLLAIVGGMVAYRRVTSSSRS